MRLTLHLLALGNFALASGAFVVPGLLAPLASDLGVPLAAGGSLMSAYALAYALCAPLLVAATGIWPRRRVLLLGLAIVAAGNLALALAPALAHANAARVLSAVGGALYSPVAAAVAIALSPPERRARALAIVFTGMTLAQVLGVPLGTALAQALGWRAVFVAVAGLAVLAALPVALRVPGDLRVQPAGLGQLGRALRDPGLSAATGVTVLFFAGQFVVFTFLGPVITATSGAEGGRLTLMLWVFGLASVAANIGGGIAADRLGPVPTITVLCVGSALTLAVLPLLEAPAVVVAGALIAWAAFGYSFMTPQQTRLVALAPDAQAIALSLNASAVYLGSALGGAVGAAVVAARGLHALGWAAATLVLAALTLLRLSLRLAPSPARP